jgi:fructose-1,6-bisphosphatase/inositol monophosphatase family enzyme
MGCGLQYRHQLNVWDICAMYIPGRAARGILTEYVPTEVSEVARVAGKRQRGGPGSYKGVQPSLGKN